MNEQTNAAPAAAHPAANEGRAIILKEIKAKWAKFQEAEISALKNRDDLIKLVTAKYGLEKASIMKDVDSFLKGRHL
jgi:hypothetical protein